MPRGWLSTLSGVLLASASPLFFASAAPLAGVAAPAPASASGVSQGSNQKIAMVTDTLKDILQSVVNEEKEETAIYGKYMKWCSDETSSIASDTKESESQLAGAKVLSEEQQSSIDSLKLYIKKSSKDIEEVQDALAQATALRNEENEKYAEELQINTQSLRQIDAAIERVGKLQQQGGFLQNGVVKKLQINQAGEPSYVFGVMKGLKDKLSKSRELLMKTEEEKVKMHNSFMKTKGEALKLLQDTTTKKKIELTEVTAKESNVQRKINKGSEEVAKLQEAAGRTEEACEKAQQEWKIRSEDRTKEKAALSEAVRYLTETGKEQSSLLQSSNHRGEDEDTVVFAPNFLQTASAPAASDDTPFEEAADEALLETDENAESEVEAHVRKDAFNGVKSVVMKLIGTHQDSQKEETEKKKYCETELASKEDEKASVTEALSAVSANIDKKTSEVKMLSTEVTELEKSQTELKKSLADAGKVRAQEKSVFESGTKDRTLAIKVLKQAKTVLENFYKSKALIQTQDVMADSSIAPPAKWAPGSARKTASSFSAVSMVEEIADDVKKEQTDALMAEKEAATAFAEMQARSQKLWDDKQQDITERVSTRAKLGVQINTLKETKVEKSEELDSIVKQLGSLHESCDELLKNYGKRKEARTFEVSQLKDVMDILSGSSIAARTGLFQEASDDSAMSSASDSDGASNQVAEQPQAAGQPVTDDAAMQKASQALEEAAAAIGT